MEKEINLSDIIIKLWKSKIIIGSVLLASILSSTLISYFMLSPVYSVSTTVALSNPQEKGVNLVQVIEQVKNQFVISRVMGKLGIRDQMNPDVFQKNIVLQVIKDSSTIRIAVEGKTPHLVTDTANMMAMEIGYYIEYASRTTKLETLNNLLRDVEDSMEVTKQQLSEVNNQLTRLTETVTLKKTLADDPYLQSVFSDNSALANSELGQIVLIEEEVNAVYETVKSTQTTLSIELSKLSAEEKNLKSRIERQEANMTKLEDLITQNTLHSDKYFQTVNDNNAVLFAPAIVPEEPVGPNKSLIVGISAVAAVILSSLFVVIRDIIKQDEESAS